MAEAGDAHVHLHLRGPLDDDSEHALRQQLATCLASGVKAIAVHVDTQPELDLSVLRTLQGAADYLASCGGSLTLVGARPSVRDKLRIFEMDRLLGSAVDAPPLPAYDPYPAVPVAEPAASAGSSRVG